MELARFEGFTYWYPEADRAAVTEVNISLREGLTMVGGPSGGGKSTFLRALNGLVPHFHGGRVAGRATVLGRDILITPKSDLARAVGFLFQDPERQFVHSTVERDVAFSLENAGLSPLLMIDRVEEALAAVGALHLATRIISSLSGGERQRVALAGVIALQPRLLALDEPTTQQEQPGAADLAAACLRLRAGGTSIVVAEQRQELLRESADSHLAIAAGSVSEGCHPRLAPPSRKHGSSFGPQAWGLLGVTAGVDRPVVEGFTLAGRQGEVVGLTGRNGSGKTTLLRTLAGLIKPLRGSVERPPGRTAYLPQDPAALLHQPTVRAELELTVARTRGGDDCSQLLEVLGLADLADRYPRDLSGGERQRAAIAAVIAGRPALALLDEPTRGMDGLARAQLARAIERLVSNGGSVLIASHDRDLLDGVADRVVELGS
ncbi:MAG: ATP-binding cassette domain-containing protein [Candidatus Dormibacteraeota bacterium]|nr:ATP-binding cassette domain-containing protein [Candidatus Dormibacteraeota bacterium]